MTNGIYILNATGIQDAGFTAITQSVQKAFSLPVIYQKYVPDTDKAYDHSRRQYQSTAFLAGLLSGEAENDKTRILVVDVDLYIPVLTFVFGEAQFEGSAAVVSTHRLSNQFYGLANDTNRLLSRLEKEVIHELGHVFGLYHCHQFECVMRSSTYVEEIDLKKKEFCASCTAFLSDNLERCTTHSLH